MTYKTTLYTTGHHFVGGKPVIHIQYLIDMIEDTFRGQGTVLGYKRFTEKLSETIIL